MYRLALKKFKVLFAIVVAYSVAVMHPFGRKQCSPKQPLHDETMFENVTTADLKDHVTLTRYVTLTGLAALLAVGVFLHTYSVAHLDHAGDYLPVYGKNGQDITALPAQNRALNRGWIQYCFDATAEAYPNFRSQARQVVDYAAAQTTIAAVEVPWGDDCDIRNTMPPDATFLATCGQGAAACIYYWSLPVTIYYRRALTFNDWKSTFCHEGLNTGHFMGQHEEYNDREFKSNGRFWTCLDFGTGVWQVPPFDIDRVWNSWVPDRPSAAGMTTQGGWSTATWTQRRADEGAAHAFNIPFNTNATRMAFGFSSTIDGPITWAGERCGPAFDYCYTKFGDGQRGFDAAWAGLYIWGRVEAPATYRAPQFTRGDSGDGYWFLFGQVP